MGQIALLPGFCCLLWTKDACSLSLVFLPADGASHAGLWIRPDPRGAVRGPSGKFCPVLRSMSPSCRIQQAGDHWPGLLPTVSPWCPALDSRVHDAAVPTQSLGPVPGKEAAPSACLQTLEISLSQLNIFVFLIIVFKEKDKNLCLLWVCFLSGTLNFPKR